MISVVIPAYNEAAVIGRCLRTLTAGARPGELEVVVVANGCSDDTAAVAASFEGVEVLELPDAGKPAALNLGDQRARHFPRFFVDADVELGIDAVRAVADRLANGKALVAAPRLTVELRGRPWAIRAYYGIWLQMPFVRHAHVGSGVYALSEEGRRRFERFPELIADDLFIRNLFEPSERATVAERPFTVHPPRSLRRLVNVRTRVLTGNAQLRATRPELHRRAEATRPLRAIAADPSSWPGAVIYTGVYTLARGRAAWRLRRGRLATWDRDDSGRAAVR